MTGRKLFRLFYSTLFALLNIVLLGLLLITPADAIRQALNNRQLYNVFVIAGCYFVTIFLAILIYASRLYTNKSVLAGIPKTWVPVEKGDVNKKVRKMIVASLNRSAAIAWDSRPRITDQAVVEVSEPQNTETIAKPIRSKERHRQYLHKHRSDTEKNHSTVIIPPLESVWGDIRHNGWSSPMSADLPNLQYNTVILELPHLIEARAVSLAPPDPQSESEPPVPDLRAVDMLQRPASMGLREYISHLMGIGIIISAPLATNFLATYEYARFSARPLSEYEFRDLMKQFAELLKCMISLSPAVLVSLDIEQESDIDDDGSSSTTSDTQRSQSLSFSARSFNSASGSEGTIRTAPSRRMGGDTPRPHDLSTVPATPRTRRRVVSRSPSINSFAQSRKLYNGASGSSSSSLRSTSQGSIIKLSSTREEGGLPYTLNIPR